MQKNDALEIFSQLFNDITKLTKIFQSFPESVNNLSADEIANFPNDFLSLDMKVTFASNFLTLLLGRPPTIKELEEVTGESYFKIQRFLKDTDVCLPYVLRKVKSSEIAGLRRKTKRPSKDFKMFVWKGPGIRDTMDSGRPNIFPVFILSPLINTFRLTKEEERDRLLTYLASPPFVDAVKRAIVVFYKGLLEGLDTDFMRSSEKILSESLSVMWKRAVKLVKEKRSVQANEFEELPINDWMAALHTEEFKHGFYEIIREIEEMPDETFASNCIIPAFVRGLDSEGYVSAVANDKALLRCTRCLCESPIRISSKVVTCVFCGKKYKIVMRSR